MDGKIIDELNSIKQYLKQSNGKSKYEVAFEIANRFELGNVCLSEAKNLNGLEQIDKALELYLQRLKKIIETL